MAEEPGERGEWRRKGRRLLGKGVRVVVAAGAIAAGITEILEFVERWL